MAPILPVTCVDTLTIKQNEPSLLTDGDWPPTPSMLELSDTATLERSSSQTVPLTVSTPPLCVQLRLVMTGGKFGGVTSPGGDNNPQSSDVVAETEPACEAVPAKMKLPS